jgi:Na+/proline symporter
LRPWPWIITALCSIIIFPDLASIKAAFPNADPNLLGHDSAFPAMLKFLPVGFVGLMVGGLIAANSSTILTHLNWGASYLVHDFYRRFINSTASERHYVNTGRICTVLLYVFAGLLSTIMTSAQQAFQILLSIGAGTGLLYIVRWFWWRVSAWCEIAAMAASILSAVGIPYLTKLGILPPLGFAQTTILQVGFTTVCWLIAAFIAPLTEPAKLIQFYKKVHPAGPGWEQVRLEAKVTPEEVVLHGDHMGLATLGWISGCIVIWSSLFCIGNFLYGRTNLALLLLAIFIASGFVLLYVVRNLWSGNRQTTLAGPSPPISESVAK